MLIDKRLNFRTLTILISVKNHAFKRQRPFFSKNFICVLMSTAEQYTENHNVLIFSGVAVILSSYKLCLIIEMHYFKKKDLYTELGERSIYSKFS